MKNNMTDFARDLKEMMDAWDKYRAIWIKKHGNDEGFAKWYQEQIAGLERKAKTDSRLSSLCDRELARVGLSMWSSGSEAGAKSIAEREGLFYGFSILNGKWYVGTKEELDKIGVAKILGGNSLSAICDRELARVGLAARYEILDDSEVKIAEADSLSDARYAAEKAEKSGQRRVMIYDTTTGKTVAF